MKNKITLLFAALMMTLGVSAQEGTTVEDRGAAKGYYPFAAEVTEMRKLTGDDVLTPGMNILIQHNHEGTEHADHDGWFLTIYSKAEQDQTYHGIFMQEKAMGVSTFTLEQPENIADGLFLLQTAHMRATGEKCYVGTPSYDRFNTSQKYPGAYEFRYEEGKGWYIITGGYSLNVTIISGVPTPDRLAFSKPGDQKTYFNLYEVEETKGTIKYVESTIKLTGAAGNVFTTEHDGWSDFYEFTKESNAKPVSGQIPNNYAVTLSNVYYHEESNEITGGVKFPFSVSGKIAQIPVHLCSYGDTLKRFTVGDNNTVKVITRPENYKENAEWFKNQKNQWYIVPSFDEDNHFVYSIQNVATKQYLYTELTSKDLKLSATPTYFKLNSGAPGGQVRFSSYYQGPYSTYVSFLCEDSSKGHTTTTASTNVNFAVPRVSGEEAGGYDAIGFTRTYHSDTYFWDGGEIAIDDAPADLKAVFEDENHEGYDTEGSQHRIYTANTGIYVPKMGDVTVRFSYLSGTDRLTILGVDIVDALGDIVSSEYHLGYAGVDSLGNVYEVRDVPVGNYFLRYWVCNRTDYEEKKNHDLRRNSGKIRVEGADYYLTYSDAPTNGAFSSNSTWYRMRLSDGLAKYISAQPNYVDADNNLMLTNDTPPTDYAGLWAIVGDKENGYKFYNRAWGPEYAMKTEGENGKARTYMVPVDSASTYDIVQRDRSHKDYKFYVKLHKTDNYLQNFGGYNGTGHLSTWNSSGALGDAGSVMSFETLNMEVFEANTTIVKNALAEKWTPWTAEPEVAAITDDFAQLMLNRNSFALLNGKVFKFANADDAEPRKDMLLTVNGEGKGAGVAPTGKSEDYMQFIDNKNGTFKLFHIATARYLGLPDEAATTTDSTKAAAYIYTFQDAAHKEQLTFETADQTLHLNNTDFTLMNWKDADDASRWTVFYGEEAAQNLGAVAIEAQKMLERITDADYLANAGKRGYASLALIQEYQNTIQGLSGQDLAEAKATLEAAMQKIKDAQNIHVEKLSQLSNTGIYGIYCRRAPLAYVEENSTTHLSTPMVDSPVNIPADVVNHENEQFAILRTENTPAGWYYLYNITTKKFVNQNFELIDTPVCAVNFRDISSYDDDYRWEVWFGEISNGDAKLNVNSDPGLVLDSFWGMDEGNKFRIEYAETNETKTAPALAAIAKAEATAFLNDTPETVGYPVADERTTFANAIDAATSEAEVTAAKTAFVTTTNVLMPEDGKAYVIRNVQQNGKVFMLTSEYASPQLPEASATPETDNANVFICRKGVDKNSYVFVNAKHGKYMLFYGISGTKPLDGEGFSEAYSENNILKLYSQASKRMGTLSIAGKRDNGTTYGTMTINPDGQMNANGGENNPTYSESYSSLFTFEEVNYTLNKVTLTDFTEDDQLIRGLGVGSIGTFSAPYATVVPENVTAYYVKAITGSNSASLETVEGAIPAGEGVILIGATGAGQQLMLPVAGEEVATLAETNLLIGSGATGAEMNGTSHYILAKKQPQGIGLYLSNAGTLKAGKAYLDIPSEGQQSFVLKFGGATTDIDNILELSDAETIYDLSGRRISKITKSGIYVVNGKKVIVK